MNGILFLSASDGKAAFDVQERTADKIVQFLKE